MLDGPCNGVLVLPLPEIIFLSYVIISKPPVLVYTIPRFIKSNANNIPNIIPIIYILLNLKFFVQS